MLELRIQHCHCSGTGAIPGLGNFHMPWAQPKKKKLVIPHHGAHELNDVISS